MYQRQVFSAGHQTERCTDNGLEHVDSDLELVKGELGSAL